MLLGFGWTDERVELLKSLYACGRSATQIAIELRGGFSRNAIIGKIHRLGLSGRPKKAPAPRVPRQPREKPRRQVGTELRIVNMGRHLAVVPVLEAIPEPALIEIPVGQRCSIFQLDASKCRFPYGDPRDSSFYFCGAAPVEGKAYCGAHCRTSFQPCQRR